MAKGTKPSETSKDVRVKLSQVSKWGPWISCFVKIWQQVWEHQRNQGRWPRLGVGGSWRHSWRHNREAVREEGKLGMEQRLWTWKGQAWMIVLWSVKTRAKAESLGLWFSYYYHADFWWMSCACPFKALQVFTCNSLRPLVHLATISWILSLEKLQDDRCGPCPQGAPSLEGGITGRKDSAGCIQLGQRRAWKRFPKVLILELHFELAKLRRGATYDRYSITTW